MTYLYIVFQHVAVWVYLNESDCTQQLRGSGAIDYVVHTVPMPMYTGLQLKQNHDGKEEYM